jgi:hypothetical protein
MKNTKKKLLIAICLALALFSLASCAAEAPLDKENGGAYYDGVAPDYTEEGALGKEDVTLNDGSIPGSQKLITTVHMTVESKEYDTLVNGLIDKVKAAGGYVENSKVSVRGQNDLRHATLILRVPADKLSLLTDAVKEGATVTSYEESAVDVSLTYADLEGRLSALRAEQTALHAMLEKADSVSAAIEIQSRLSQVRGEIESIESQLRVLDSKISFSTLTLTVFEVEKETVPKKELSFFEEIKDRFSESAKDSLSYFRNLTIFLVGSIPTILSVLVTLLLFLLPPVAIVLLVLLIVSILKKKSKKKKAEK